MKYCVLDLETNGTTTYKRFCNPLDDRHTIELYSYKLNGREAKVSTTMPFSQLSVPLIGQNIKFDLLYIWKNDVIQKFIQDGHLVWDTQTVEYLLSGQASGRYNLDSLAQKYGGTIKDDRIKTMYEQGYQSKDISHEILIPYAIADAENTEIVALAQLKEVTKRGMLPLVKLYMKHYLAVCEMEFNGLYVNQAPAWEKLKELEEQLEELLKNTSPPNWSQDIPFSPLSNQHISVAMFGGALSYTVDEQQVDEEGNVIKYKTGLRKGEIKTKKTKKIFDFDGLYPRYGTGFYPVDEKVLQQYDCEFTKKILKIRELNKLISTYYYSDTGKKQTGLLSLIHPDGCVHSEYKTAFTTTGRLASTNPNVQNMPPSILDMFSSRWGDDGMICEMDFSQLEVIVQAYLTQCPNMIRDIENGVDFHCKRLAYAEGLSYEEVYNRCQESHEWKLKRKAAKQISFQKAYGAHPQSIAKSTGLSVDVVTRVFEKEDEEYPEINQFYELINEEVKKTRRVLPTLINIKNRDTGEYFQREGEQDAVGFYTSVTGKKYTYTEKAVLTQRGVFRYFSQPDIQNYVVQGTAADIVAGTVGRVFEFLKKHRDKALMINEVHDSLILDVKKDYVDWTIENVLPILKDVRGLFKDTWGLDFNVPIDVGYKFGKNWLECKE